MSRHSVAAMEEIERRCLEQTGRVGLCAAVARVLAEVAETCQVCVRKCATTLPCGLLRSAAVTVYMARDGAVATIKLHEDFYLVVEIAEAGVKYHMITPEYGRVSN